MSARTTLRALPTLMKIGFAEAVAYRAEMLVWILSTTMPFVMWALWSAVAREQPVGRFGQEELTAYFLITFVVRQIVSSWVGWEMNFEIRNGTLSMRLLRPLPPIVGYAVENLAALPLRMVVVVPVLVLTIATAGIGVFPDDPLIWAALGASLVGGWLIAFSSQFLMGALALYMQSSLKVLDVWFTAFVIFSGYLFPLELLPGAARAVIDWLPFRFFLGLPVELATNLHERGAALTLLLRQWLWAVLFIAGALAVWRRGLRRFAAYGG